MNQIFEPLFSNYERQILCCYFNATTQIQIARITNIPNWYFERVVFPRERLLFEALPDAQMEIHTGMLASAIVLDKIPCKLLRVSEGSSSFIDTAHKQKVEVHL